MMVTRHFFSAKLAGKATMAANWDMGNQCEIQPSDHGVFLQQHVVTLATSADVFACSRKSSQTKP
jgi:hypothetical protein